MAVVKIPVLERDGTEYQDAIEYILLSEDIPYDNATSGLIATYTQAAIDELAASTATDFLSGWETIDAPITIPAKQQMVVFDTLYLNDTLTINGTLVLRD